MAQRGLLITFFQEHWSTFQESAPVQQRVPTLAREVILLKAQREAYIFTPRVPSHLAKECADCAIQNHIAPKQALYCVPGWNVIERIDDNPRSRGQIPEFRRMRMSSCREPNSLR